MITAIDDNPLWTVPYGVGMFDTTIEQSTSQPNEVKHRILMEEVGHTLGAGTADDKILGVGECYSGGSCYGFGPMGSVTGGGEDTTPERIRRNGDTEWPVMGDADYYGNARTAFSIEEISTIDFNDTPTIDE
ncbi:hypothetical protein G9463_15480 [Haloarcula sp. JP-Z28]|uniref:hypothetical protein n=1 Tax=Haloarcula sp. JP-Z28 TaxID=2716715 RepID=UPI0014050A50|nr:hypothetical protein [Haloarcula sp. JP-Z28]NHN64690.1 hypothetical protein [Haloarcula sp. JP-Z28]